MKKIHQHYFWKGTIFWGARYWFVPPNFFWQGLRFWHYRRGKDFYEYTLRMDSIKWGMKAFYERKSNRLVL
jgi:hypothetical protein